MSDILIRDLDPETIRRLKAQAKRNGRSLQSEARLLVERAVGTGGDHLEEMLDRWRRRFAGRKFSSSARIIREDRGR